jgi:hypothetical protein
VGPASSRSEFGACGCAPNGINEPRASARAVTPQSAFADAGEHAAPDVDEREATRRAIISTGSVISSCGIIMAATLGSLWAGGLTLLQQVGFAMALGVLIDTFLVRPLLVPSFFLAAGRARKHRPVSISLEADSHPHPGGMG